MSQDDEQTQRAVETRLVTSGRSDPRVISSPVYHVSTVLFQDYAELKAREAQARTGRDLYYGRMGTPTTRALEDAVCALDGSCGAVLTPSGVASITDILSCFLAPGDHLLMVDSVYGPTRNFCVGALAKRGIETTFYDPMIGSELESLIRDNTRLLFLESPGSATFEVQDIPALVEIARRRGLITAIDNTWATPLFFNPLDFGVDLAMQSGTKYLNGHADCLFGVTTARDEALFQRLRHYTLATGSHLAPDDAMLALRGLRTLAARLPVHERSALEVAAWLEGQERVVRILHPALPSCPGHEFFKRDFKGSTGLFGFVLEVGDEAALERFLNRLRIFGMGFSWGGFESLCLPMEITRTASAAGSLPATQVLIRLHIGLENTADLTADLATALAAL
jgi:cystathionine beta-lyase